MAYPDIAYHAVVSAEFAKFIDIYFLCRTISVYFRENQTPFMNNRQHFTINYRYISKINRNIPT